jgi:uncharacterized protein (UPF0332 family)
MLDFCWKDFLRLAKQYDGSDDPAELRTAISRAYYAAHHTAKEFCVQYLKLSPNAGASDHFLVFSTLQKHSDDGLRAVGRRLSRLHKDRLNADYDKNLPWNPVSQTSFDLGEADAIIDGLIYYLKPKSASKNK